jgi:FtsZ-binding cell division protein ZapB
MLDQIASDTVVVLTGAGTFVGLALYLRRLFKNLGLEDTRRAAEQDIIKHLRDEVTRLAAINTEMSNALTHLQLEVINLRNENITLTGEIAALRNENAQLTREVLTLNEQIMKWDKKCDNCRFKFDKE